MLLLSFARGSFQRVHLRVGTWKSNRPRFKVQCTTALRLTCTDLTQFLTVTIGWRSRGGYVLASLWEIWNCPSWMLLECGLAPSWYTRTAYLTSLAPHSDLIGAFCAGFHFHSPPNLNYCSFNQWGSCCWAGRWIIWFPGDWGCSGPTDYSFFAVWKQRYCFRRALRLTDCSLYFLWFKYQLFTQICNA